MYRFQVFVLMFVLHIIAPGFADPQIFHGPSLIFMYQTPQCPSTI
jgi:hypothetical protein